MVEPRSIKNKHGRKGGRGIRPWLLMPKVLAVGCVVGGLMAMLVIALSDLDVGGEVLRLILKSVVGPGVLVAMVCGVGLFAQHAVVFWRMRWLRVKFVVVMCLLGSLLLLWDKVGGGIGGGAGMIGLRMNLLVSIGLVVVLVVLGRMKPRLGMSVMKVEKKIKEESK